jgi:hypothetical protein
MECAYDGDVLDVMLAATSGIEGCRGLREAKRWVPDQIAGEVGEADDADQLPVAQYRRPR